MTTPISKDSELEEILDGYYGWCMKTVAEALKSEPILGTGSSKQLSPSEAKAALYALIEREVIGEDDGLEQSDVSFDDDIGDLANQCRNRLRAIQRTRLRKLFGMEDSK